MSPRHPAGEELGMSGKQQFERIWKCDPETAWGSRSTRPIHLRFGRQNPRRTLAVLIRPEHRGSLQPSLDWSG